MGCGKPNDEDNPPVPLKQSDEVVLTSKESEASDNGQMYHINNTSQPAIMPLTFVSGPNSSWENAYGMHQPYTQDPRNNLPGFIRPGTPPNAHIDDAFIDLLRGRFSNGDTCSSGTSNPQVNANFVANPSTIPGGYYINAHLGDGRASDLTRSQITESSLCSNNRMVQSAREINVNNNTIVGVSSPGKFDGSFLTLGIGGSAEYRNKHKFSTKEIASCLGISDDVHAGQSTPKFSTGCQILTGSSSGPQSNPRLFPGSMSSGLGALTPSCNNDRISNHGVVGPSSSALQDPRMLESFKQYDFFQSKDSNLGITSKSLGAYSAQGPYNQYVGDPSAPLMPFSDSEPYTSRPGFARVSDLASGAANFTRTTPQPTTSQQNYHARNIRDATSYYASNSISPIASPITQDYLGKLIPPVQDSMTQAVGGGPSIGVQPIGHISSTAGVSSAMPFGYTTPVEQIVQHFAAAKAIKPVSVFPFPRRLGVQLCDGPQSVNQSIPLSVMGVQSRGGVHQSQPEQLTNNFLGSPSGNAQDSLAPQFNVQRPLPSSGPVLVNAGADKPSQVSNATGPPSLKRRAASPPPVVSWGRRKRLVHLSSKPNATIYRQGTAASLPPPGPSGTPHIRWQGLNKEPQLVGSKCSLCNRDLSFEPEGEGHQPSIPPPVAVLPCGHSFHDQCLQRITPEDQSTEPPCIPCAIGEA